MGNNDFKTLPKDTYFNDEDILCHADGTPVEDGAYLDSQGHPVIIEGNSGDIFLPE